MEESQWKKWSQKRKKRQNLDGSGMKHYNPFVVLNSLEDEVLIQIATDLDISLASDDEGNRRQISAIKVEERVRASIAKANY
jgi:hypothetical protein